MGSMGTLGTVNAQFAADTKQFDASLSSSEARMAAAAKKAEQLGQAVTQLGAASDRAATAQERASERARRAWQQELIQQDRAIQAEQEAARAKELAALKADILSRSLEKQAGAQNAVNTAVEHGVPQYAAASAAVRALEGGMNNNVRAAERFLSTTLGLGPALQVLFPVAGGLAFMDILIRMSTKIMEIAQNWEGVKDAEKDALSALEKTDTEGIRQASEHSGLIREQQMAMVGLSVPREGRAAAEQAVSARFDIADAKTKLSDLQSQIDSGNAQIRALDLQRRSQQTQLVTKYGTAPGQFDPTKDPVSVYEPTNDADWARGKMAEIGDAMETASREKRNVQQQILTLQAQQRLQLKEAQEGAGRGERRDATQQMGTWRQQLEAQKAGHTMTLDDEAAYWQKLADSVKRGSVLYNSALMEANKARTESLKQYQSAFIASVLSDAEARRQAQEQSQRVSENLQENWDAANARDREEAKAIEESASRAFEAAEQQRKTADRLAEETIKLREASGQLSRAGAAQALATIHQESFASWSAAATSFSAQFPTAALPGGAQTMREYETQAAQDEAAQEATTALGALRETTDKLTQSFLDLPAHLQQMLVATVNGFNGAFSSAVMAPARSGHEYRQGITSAMGGQFRTAGSRGLDAALQMGEGGLLKTLGFGNPKSKPDGTAGNPLWVRMAQAAAGVSGLSGLGSLFSGVASDAGATTPGSSLGMINTAMSLATEIPMFASGGAIPSNMPAIVGERGPELFMPTSSGRIIPNDQLGGGGKSGDVHFHIDARGATDPAAVQFSIDRALAKYDRTFQTKAVASIRNYNRGVTGTARV